MGALKDDLEGIDFGSKKLEKRFLNTVEIMADNPGKSILQAMGNRNQAKAVYRMLSNENYSTEKVKKEYAEATARRMEKGSIVLAVQDTTELDYGTHTKTKGLGYCNQTDLGLQIHSCTALTPEGIMLGLLDQKSYSRAEKKNTSMTEYEKRNRPIEEKETYRWIETYDESMKYIPEGVKAITVCDRGADFYELYEHIIKTGGTVIIRLEQDRLIQEDQKALEYLRSRDSSGTIVVDIPRDTRKGKKARQATLEIRYGEMRIKKPARRKEKHLEEEVTVNGVYAKEIGTPEGIEGVEWFLITTEGVKSFEEAVIIIEYYVQRWKIERFHYVLKEGCKAEDIQERTRERIESLVYLYSIISIFIMTLTYLARINPEIGCDVLFEEEEWKILYCAANKTTEAPERPYKIKEAVKYLGKLGGFAGAPSDGNPGVKVLWRGMEKLYTLVEYKELLRI